MEYRPASDRKGAFHLGGLKFSHARFERLQRRALRGEPVDFELKDALRCGQIFQAVRTEVAHVRVHERLGRLRQEDLSSVPVCEWTCTRVSRA